MTHPIETTADENTETDENVAAALEELAAAPLPPSTVDVERARAAGRRMLRRRRAVGGTGAAAVALAAAVVVVAIAPGGGTSALVTGTVTGAASGTTSGNTSSTASGATSGTVPAPVDPLTADAAFGWLPAGFTVYGYSVDGGDHTTDAESGDKTVLVDLTTSTSAGTSANPAMTDVTTTRIGTLNGQPVTLMSPHPADLPSTPAASIHGLPGGGPSIAADPTIGAPQLDLIQMAWQSGTGRSVTLMYNYEHPADRPSNAILLHIAETVTFDTRQIPLPFSISGMRGAGVQSVVYDLGGAGLGPTTAELTLEVDGRPVFITATTGSPAVPVDTPATSIATKKINGLTYSVQFTDGNASSASVQARLADARQFLNRIVSYGPDDRLWTTDVLKP